MRSRDAAKFRRTVFDNGLTLVCERHPEFRGLSIGVWVRVGTRHESAGERGAAHFLEHMLFKGTRSRTALEIAREIDRVGGDFNAFTAREHTCFHLLLLDRDFTLGLDILGDVILNSTFEEEELRRERKVILQEISMIDESPEELAHDLLLERIFPRHGLGRSILGSEASIRRMRRADLVSYFHAHYRPEQLIISVCGNIDHEWVRRALRPLLASPWPGRRGAGGTSVGSRSSLDPAPEHREGRWWIERNTEQAHLIWGVPGPPYISRDRYAVFLLNIHLGGGMSSRLFQEIREKRGLAYTVYSSLTPFSDTGVFSVYAATGIAQAPVCLRLIEEAAQKVTEELLPETELRLIQENLKGTILLSSDGAESRMFSIARDEMIFGRYLPVEEMLAQIDAVTPEDIRRVARQYLGAVRKGIVLIGPKPPRSVRSRLRPFGFMS